MFYVFMLGLVLVMVCVGGLMWRREVDKIREWDEVRKVGWMIEDEIKERVGGRSWKEGLRWGKEVGLNMLVYKNREGRYVIKNYGDWLKRRYGV